MTTDLNAKLNELEEITCHLNQVVQDLKDSPVKVDINNNKWLNHTANAQKKFYEDTTTNVNRKFYKIAKYTEDRTNEMLDKIDSAIEQQKRIATFKIMGVFTFQIISMAFLLFLFFNVLSSGLWEGLGLHMLWAHGEWWSYTLAVLLLIGLMFGTLILVVSGCHKIYKYIEYNF